MKILDQMRVGEDILDVVYVINQNIRHHIIHKTMLPYSFFDNPSSTLSIGGVDVVYTVTGKDKKGKDEIGAVIAETDHSMTLPKEAFIMIHEYSKDHPKYQEFLNLFERHVAEKNGTYIPSEKKIILPG